MTTESVVDGSKGDDSAVLSAEGIAVQFGGLIALSDVTLELNPGTITGLIGPNGAGKSTLLSVLSGLRDPDRGRVRFKGVDVTAASAQARSHRGMARTFQHPELFTSITIRDQFRLAYRLKHSRYRRWTDLLTGGGFSRPSIAETNQVDKIIELLRLGPIADRQPVGLPLGISRVVELGRAMASDPDVMLLDEPASGLDIAERSHFGDILLRIIRDGRRSLLLVEHDIDLVMRLCDWIYVLDFGLLIGQGSSAEIRGNEAVRTAYLGDVNDGKMG